MATDTPSRPTRRKPSTGERISVRLPYNVLLKIDAEAKRTDRNRSYVIRNTVVSRFSK